MNLQAPAQPVPGDATPAAPRGPQRLGRHLAGHPRPHQPRGTVAAARGSREATAADGLRACASAWPSTPSTSSTARTSWARPCDARAEALTGADGLVKPRARTSGGNGDDDRRTTIRAILDRALAGRELDAAEGDGPPVAPAGATSHALIARGRRAAPRTGRRRRHLRRQPQHQLHQRLHQALHASARSAATTAPKRATFSTTSEVVRRAREARELGATEVCIQAGLPPKLDGWLLRRPRAAR